MTAMARCLGQVLLVLCLLNPVSALAHAVLLETAPAGNAALDDAPIEAVLTFNEAVAPLAIPPAAGPPIRRAVWLGLAMTPAALGLHGADALGLPAQSLGTAPPWTAGWGTSFGAMTVLALLAGLTALAGFAIRPLAFVAVGALAAAYASAGHAGAAAPQWLTRPAVFLHIAALCFWLGALAPLAFWLRRPDAVALRRFSGLIPLAVVLLAASGITIAILQMGSGTEGWATGYGRILIAKLSLLTVLFLLAAWNRWSLTAPALAGAPVQARRLRHVIRVEILLAVAILGLAAGWRFTPPPRALAELAAVPAHVHMHTAEVMADVTVTPGAAGPVTVDIFLADGDMQPSVPQSLVLALSLPERNIERMTVDATAGADGVWRVEELVLPLPGRWQIELEIRLSRFAMSRITGEIDIK